jgi:hypothetical protein
MHSPPSPTRGLSLEGHDSLSITLAATRRQMDHVRALVRGALGKSSASAQAAVALLEAVDHLKASLLGELDREYPEPDPAVQAVRTRYHTGTLQGKGGTHASQ